MAAGQPVDLAVDLAVRGLTKRFGAVTALDGIGFEIRRGEAVALIGANGSGKSTCLRCCLRLVPFDAGSISLLGCDVGGLPKRELRRLRARVGFVFQRHNLVPRLSALTNVVHGVQARAGGPRTWLQTFAKKAWREEAMARLEAVGLAHLAAQRADTLSGGQSQRVAIARALMQRPEIVIADEPVASLDPAAGEEVMALFVDLVRRQGLTLLFTTHRLAHATDFADRIVALQNGRIVLDQPAKAANHKELHRLYAAA